MKFATIVNGGAVAFGPVEGDSLADVSAHFGSQLEALRLDRREELDRVAVTAPRVALAGASFLPPVPEPRRILCIGVNYHAHRAESDRPSDSPYPTVFVRFPSSIVGHEQPLVRPHVSDRFDWEGELAVVIGREARYVAAADALDYVAGYACFQDGTLRDYQRHSSQFIPGKTFEQSGACGPFVVSADEVGDPSALDLRTVVNGVEMQHASTADLIHNIPALIAYCSEFTRLQPGDIIATGTPGGVGYARTPPIFLAPGDVVEVIIERVGTLRNTVVDEAV
jgi:2-keto-4-pentenoate hydratase/2-oxohepta-3-ene-1,7-dioic acid hydratase in catechol pathway